jgi:heme A synthase
MIRMDSMLTQIRERVRISPVSYVHFSAITLVVTFLVMLLGAYTSAIGAGLSCPDWPMCYGTWVPFLHPDIVATSSYSPLQIFAEWAHRGLAMIAGFLILGTALGAWLCYPETVIVKWSATMALILLPTQVLLGGLTVTANLQPIVVTSHIGVATVILLSFLTASLTSSVTHEA